MMLFSSFMFGIPYRSRPPNRSLRSNTVTVWPIRFSSWAAASPEGPLPTTAIRLPVLTDGTRGFTHPFAQAVSMMACSLAFTATGFPFRPQVQAASQRAGHTRHVNSGKLCVFERRS